MTTREFYNPAGDVASHVRAFKAGLAWSVSGQVYVTFVNANWTDYKITAVSDGGGNFHAAVPDDADTAYLCLTGSTLAASPAVSYIAIAVVTAWHYSTTAVFIAQFGQINEQIQRDLDESGVSDYLANAGANGDAYIDGKLRGMGLTLPLPALNASSIAWMQDVSNHAARWRLKDAREIWDMLGLTGALDKQRTGGIDKKYIDDQLDMLASGDVVLVGADGAPIKIVLDYDWLSGLGAPSVGAVTPKCPPLGVVGGCCG